MKAEHLIVNKKACFLGGILALTGITFFIMFLCFSVHSADTQTLNILNLLKTKQYKQAVSLLEKEITRIKDKNKKGYYAFLLNQLPADVQMRTPRHQYAFMSAKWALDIPTDKKLLLWIEAGDGFFKNGFLDKAQYCYQQALPHLSKGQESKKAYILHKQAWVYINRQNWTKALELLNKALKTLDNQLQEIILFDIGKIWAESQYYKPKAPLLYLEQAFENQPQEDQKIISQGVAQGISRAGKNSLKPLVAGVSKNKDLSTVILNNLLQQELVAGHTHACSWLEWLEVANPKGLNTKGVFAVLNSCANYWISQKSSKKKPYLKKIASLYDRFQKQGHHYWQLALIYQTLSQYKKACHLALTPLTQALNNPKAYRDPASVKPKKDVSLKSPESLTNQEFLKSPESLLKKDISVLASLKMALNFCGSKLKKPSPLMSRVLEDILLLALPAKHYKVKDGEYESTLFYFLSLPVFSSLLKPLLLKAHKNWRGKALLPSVLILQVKALNQQEVTQFMDRFSQKPLKEGPYLNILMAREDIITAPLLKKWLPLEQVDSYQKAKPYIKLSLFSKKNSISETEKDLLSQKLLQYFPKDKKSKKQVALYLALYYLKADKLVELFKNWDRVKVAFIKNKALSVQFFEKSMAQPLVACVQIKSLAPKELQTSQMLSFIKKCCPVVLASSNMVALENKPGVKVGGPLPRFHALRPPLSLRSSPLAWDFVLLSKTQKKTFRLEKSISKLESQTSKMVMDLQKSVLNYQKRKWQEPIIAHQVKMLLKKQITLFEKELTRLAKSSTYGQKYKELKAIIGKWRN